jgi:hypothetical protein
MPRALRFPIGGGRYRVLRQQAQATALIDLLEKYRKQSRFGSYALRGVIIIADAATDSRHANVEDRLR